MAGRPVVIKGTGEGILLQLDDTLPFEDLLREVHIKFEEASAFFGKARLGLQVRGRILSAEEEEELLNVIESSSEVHIVCLVYHDTGWNQVFAKYVHPEDQPDKPGPGDARIHTGDLRDTETLESDYSLVILGNVPEGAQVRSRGSILVSGSLEGSADAGTDGCREAIVAAGTLKPSAVTIAGISWVPEDTDVARKGWTLLGKRSKTVSGPEALYVGPEQDSILRADLEAIQGDAKNLM